MTECIIGAMRRVIITILVSTVGILALPSPGAACSLGDSRAEPPANEMAYDAALAPSAPEVVLAEVQHHDDSPGCPIAASCGSYSNVWLELQVEVEGDEEWTSQIVRIDGLPDGESVYLGGSAQPDGRLVVTLLGYGDLAEPVPITVTHINTLGYPSLPVDAMLLPGSADGGCSIGGTGPTSALLVLLALASTRLRRRDRCVGRRS